MEPIDYRSDFSFLLEITDKNGNVVPLSELDFDGQAYTAMKPGFAFACKEGVCRNCTMRGDKVLIICDRHGLRPGKVKVELRVHYPDKLYPDGIRTEFLKVTTGITLGYGCECKPSDTIAKVTATTPTYIKAGNSKAKAFRLSEYCARGMISSASQPGVIYWCDSIRFPRRAAIKHFTETGERKCFEVDITRLLGDNFDPDNLPSAYGFFPWEYEVQYREDGHAYLVYRLADDVGEMEPIGSAYYIHPLYYDLGKRHFMYIHPDGHIVLTQTVRPVREYPFHLPGELSEWVMLPGRYQLQRREQVKLKRAKRKLRKWCNIQREKKTQNARAFGGKELYDRLTGFKCGVFRMRRISNENNPRRRSEWITFSLWHDNHWHKIKKL